MKISWFVPSIFGLFGFLRSLYNGNRVRKIRKLKEAVFITGCDSGIGLYFAKYLSSLGLVVFAGVLDDNGEGAQILKSLKTEGQVVLVKLDVTHDDNVERCMAIVAETIDTRGLELSAVINNAGVMVFGEFEWQTEEQIMRQINVNLVGYIRVAKASMRLLRRSNGRLVNVSSHCSLVPLPCLAVYSATKAAIEAWSSALVLELHKFEIPVITILPGSYVRESAILKKHPQEKEAMWKSMSPELQNTYRTTFEPVMDYISAVPHSSPAPIPIDDPALLSILSRALFSIYPKRKYINSPTRYTLYHTFIALLSPFPTLRRRLILSYINLPNYK